jgi:uncharacterized membrane protein
MPAGLQPSWKNPRILLLLAMVFACGAICGAVVYQLSSQKVSAKRLDWKPANKEKTLERLKQELQLTPEQAVEIETALDDFALYYQMLQSQIDELMTTGRKNIDHVLNEAQRKKFAKMMEELRKQEGK